MKVFLCFAFEKGELQRGHLSPDKESRELFAKCKGEALIIGVTDKRRCRVSSCPPLRPGPAAPGKPWVAPAPLSLRPRCPQLLPRVPSVPGWWARAMDGTSMGAAGGQCGGLPIASPVLMFCCAVGPAGWEKHWWQSPAGAPALSGCRSPQRVLPSGEIMLENRKGEIWCLRGG